MQKRTFAVRVTNVVGDYAFVLPAEDAVDACCAALRHFERRHPGSLDGHRLMTFGLIEKEVARELLPCVDLDGALCDGQLIERDFGRPAQGLRLAVAA